MFLIFFGLIGFIFLCALAAFNIFLEAGLNFFGTFLIKYNSWFKTLPTFVTFAPFPTKPNPLLKTKNSVNVPTGSSPNCFVISLSVCPGCNNCFPICLAVVTGLVVNVSTKPSPPLNAPITAVAATYFPTVANPGRISFTVPP